jgi:putative ABC transport system permease protein
MNQAASLTTHPPAHTKPPSIWRLSWRQLWRDLRAGELRLLVVAVVLAVAALTAVGFFADRLNSGLARDARQLLGGDAVLSGDKPTPEAITAQAQALGLQTSRTVTFPSMARAPDALGGAARLVAVKAVSNTYPLRGQLRVQSATPGVDEAIHGGPAPGTVWLEQAVLDSLGLKVGDALLLGDASLQVARIITIETDRGAGFMSFSPRVMLSEQDLPATALIQPASRVTYRLAVASPTQDDAQVKRFVTWTEAHIESQKLRGQRVESLEAGRPEMRQTLERAEKFLNLVALLAALLAAVAVAIAARDFAQRRLNDCAMLRVLGQSQRRISAQYWIEFFAVGLFGSLLGVLLGWVVHHVFVLLLAGLVDGRLPAASLWPALWGLGVGLTLLLSFGLPPVLQLARVPALRVMRQDVGPPKASSVLVLAAGLCGFAGLLLAVASDWKLGLMTVGGFAGAVAAFALLSWVAVKVLQRAVPQSRAPRWLVLATRQIAARPGFAVLQVSALSVGLLALMLLVLLRTDLISSWRQATPPDAPNRFVINIQPEQSEPFQQHLKTAGVTQFDWYPMIRGRLTAINGQAVTQNQYDNPRAQRLVEREFNLSHGAQVPGHNQVSSGRWLAEEADGVSVEDGLADTLGLRLGDRLQFDIAGQLVERRITSLRKVDWGSMRVNFFVLFPQAEMPELPSTRIAAFKAPTTSGFDNRLSREFPNITTVDVSASIAQVQRVLEQVIRAVEFLFGFTLAAGLVVLFSAITATREARAHEFAVMRALGASSHLLRQVQRAELLGVGALAGLLAAAAAMGVGWALARYVFEFNWTAAPWVPVAGAVAGALLAWLAGWWGLRDVLRRPVVQTLRSAQV